VIVIKFVSSLVSHQILKVTVNKWDHFLALLHSFFYLFAFKNYYKQEFLVAFNSMNDKQGTIGIVNHIWNRNFFVYYSINPKNDKLMKEVRFLMGGAPPQTYLSRSAASYYSVKQILS